MLLLHKQTMLLHTQWCCYRQADASSKWNLYPPPLSGCTKSQQWNETQWCCTKTWWRLHVDEGMLSES